MAYVIDGRSCDTLGRTLANWDGPLMGLEYMMVLTVEMECCENDGLLLGIEANILDALLKAMSYGCGRPV